MRPQDWLLALIVGGVVSYFMFRGGQRVWEQIKTTELYKRRFPSPSPPPPSNSASLPVSSQVQSIQEEDIDQILARAEAEAARARKDVAKREPPLTKMKEAKTTMMITQKVDNLLDKDMTKQEKKKWGKSLKAFKDKVDDSKDTKYNRKVLMDRLNTFIDAINLYGDTEQLVASENLTKMQRFVKDNPK
jgi:hypothetical protein